MARKLISQKTILSVMRTPQVKGTKILESLGIQPYKVVSTDVRTRRYYTLDALAAAEKWRAERDAMYQAQVAPEPPAATPPAPPPAPLPATDSTSRYIETLAQYLVHQMQQHQQALIARVDTLTAELVAERALNSDARKLLDGLRVHSEEAAKLLLNILDTLTKPTAPLTPAAMGMLFNGKDDVKAEH